MPISKEHISSPIEAGPSLLDVKQLPPQLLSALDYVSKRLAQKRLHLSLIVVRKDINIPGIPLAESPKTPHRLVPSLSSSPARAFFNSASSTFSKTLGKSSPSPTGSETGSTTSVFSRAPFSRTRLSSLPVSPQARNASPPPPSTPSQQPSRPPLQQSRFALHQPPPLLIHSNPSSQRSTPSIPSPNSPSTPVPNAFGISLIHACTLTERAEKILRHTVAKAEKKFSIG